MSWILSSGVLHNVTFVDMSVLLVVDWHVETKKVSQAAMILKSLLYYGFFFFFFYKYSNLCEGAMSLVIADK